MIDNWKSSIDIRAENNKERDTNTVAGPLEPRRYVFKSTQDVESVQMKLILTKHLSTNKSVNKITCVPSLRLNDLAIIDTS